MILILSPAKSLNFKVESPTNNYSYPIFVDEAYDLVHVLSNYSPANLSELMNISSGLGELNYLRFQKWERNHTVENSKQAVFAFNGEVYNGLKADTLDKKGLLFAQKHLRILSGLYGILNPLDLVQPYRLEMGTRLQVNKTKNLYAFWNDKINTMLNQELKTQKNQCLINLASNEYSKAAKLPKITSRIVTPIFKELNGDNYRVVPIYAKKARGMMTRFIIDNKITKSEDLKGFDTAGYGYSEKQSDENNWVFTR